MSGIISYALFPVAALFLGGIITMVRPPGNKMRSAIMHFAAGVVFSLVAVELLPDIIDRHAPVEVALGFGLGTLIMLGIRYVGDKIKQKENSTTSSIPFSFLLAIGIDFLIDGFLLGLGFIAGEKAGTFLTIALAIELFSLGITVVTGMDNIRSRRKHFFVLTAMALLFVAGALLGGILLAGMSNEMLELFLSFGLAALLFLVTEELLTEAHEVKETPLLTSVFFVGFLLFLLIEMAI